MGWGSTSYETPILRRPRTPRSGAASERCPCVRFRDLRHAHATHMLSSGVHPKIASDVRPRIWCWREKMLSAKIVHLIGGYGFASSGSKFRPGRCMTTIPTPCFGSLSRLRTELSYGWLWQSRECVDHFGVLGEAHLRRILRAYAGYYNDIRTHRSLDKDAPVSRSVQRTGIISSRPILGGLHHNYFRV
jgi:hypothetical protein